MVEPYVRGDGISELGYSMENEVSLLSVQFCCSLR